MWDFVNVRLCARITPPFLPNILWSIWPCQCMGHRSKTHHIFSAIIGKQNVKMVRQGSLDLVKLPIRQIIWLCHPPSLHYCHENRGYYSGSFFAASERARCIRRICESEPMLKTAHWRQKVRCRKMPFEQFISFLCTSKILWLINWSTLSLLVNRADTVHHFLDLIKVLRASERKNTGLCVNMYNRIVLPMQAKVFRCSAVFKRMCNGIRAMKNIYRKRDWCVFVRAAATPANTQMYNTQI